MAGESELAALEAALRTGGDVGACIGPYYRVAVNANPATRSEMLAALDAPLREYPCERIGQVGILAGALVECGADPHAFPAAVFDRLLEQLGRIKDANDETELPEGYHLLERAAMACLSRSPELRAHLPQKAALLSKIQRYSEKYGFLGKMLAVLDAEPLLVLHPATQRGFRFEISGIADNFQLHTLLLGALAGDGPDRVPGERPAPESIRASSDGPLSEKVASVTSRWQLANWFGLREGGALDTKDYDRTWIWNEGVPADIAKLEGTRVVLIGPSTIQRGWNAGRVFSGMPGKLEPRGTLSAAEAGALLAKMLPS
jgi:hypothetical protein